MKKYRRVKKFSDAYVSGDEGYEVGYLDAIIDAFLPVVIFLPYDSWVTERELIDEYLEFLSEDEEARKEWPETGSFVSLALRQLKLNKLIKCKTFKEDK